MNAREIRLSSGKVAILDEEDYQRLFHYHWHESLGYAERYLPRNPKQRRVKMHQDILPPRPGFEVDHINGNRADNRRCNLRYVTHVENLQNCPSRPGSSSQYKGVSWFKPQKKWKAIISKNRIQYFLGHFDLETEAALAYNKKAIELYGIGAYVNEVNL